MINFLICGTQKGGTSALDTYLREHPEICMANVKEVHFFDREVHFDSNEVDYSKYHSYFEPKSHHKAIGEATPIYMYWKSSPKRIWQYNPNMKIIIILRNPIERAYSHWNMERMRGADQFSFWDAITNENKRCMEASPLQHRVYSYVDRGFYLRQLRNLWKFFPKKQVLVLKNEDLKNKPVETLNKICDFLNITRFESIKPKKVHARPYDAEIKPKEKDFLKPIFKAEIKNLERELQWNCKDWL
ncbi:MAG: sulfotransferase domain-containing protein [Marinicella sp.]